MKNMKMHSVIIAALAIFTIPSARATDLRQARMITFGDSITAGLGVDGPQRYANLLARDSGGVLENRAVSGQTACMMSIAQVFSKPLPSPKSGSRYATMLIGTNDSNAQGRGDYESIFRMCLRASVSWLTIPASTKALPTNGRCLVAGVWARDPKAPLEGLVSSRRGDRMNCKLTTTGGPAYLWFEASDVSNGVFAYTVDGKNVRRIAVRSRVAIRTNDGRGLTGGAAIKIDGLSAGVHTISIMNDSAPGNSNSSVKIYGVGTPSRNGSETIQLFLGGTPFQRNDRKSEDSRAYFDIAKQEVVNLRYDGLPVEFVDTRAFMRGTSQELYDDLHPNALGQSELKDAFEASIR